MTNVAYPTTAFPLKAVSEYILLTMMIALAVNNAPITEPKIKMSFFIYTKFKLYLKAKILMNIFLHTLVPITHNRHFHTKVVLTLLHNFHSLCLNNGPKPVFSFIVAQSLET